MHDFCMTIPYGFVLVIGGLIGYVNKDTLSSLAWGTGSGLLLLLAGFLSLNAFKKHKNSYLAFMLETLTATGLTYVMGQHYWETSKIIPAGITAGISALMTAFYMYKVATGGNHLPAKAD